MKHAYPTVPYPFTMPFYYSSLTNIAVYYLVPEENVLPYLQDSGLEPVLFDGKALVTYNFQLYTGQFSTGIDVPPEQWAASGASVTQELELNIVAYPAQQKSSVLPLTLQEFIQDGDQTKIMGNHRVYVPCDADMAIQAGVELFGEPKFKTTFKVNLPSLNPVRQNTVPYIPEWVQTWGFQVDDPNDASAFIFRVEADLNDMFATPGNISPITEYGVHDDRMIACRWNILQPFNTYWLDPQHAERVKLTYGTSPHPMLQDLQALLQDAQTVAVQTYNSAPAAIQSRAYYP